MPVENKAILMLLWCEHIISNTIIMNVGLTPIFFSCLFETFVSMSSDSMSKNIFQQLKVYEYFCFQHHCFGMVGNNGSKM